ncbi:MAG: hypothetical protein H6Q99_3831, partial [Proteobacteria bacterium]|nr:hypothetical protein [Pseudomonadota bacterium]
MSLLPSPLPVAGHFLTQARMPIPFVRRTPAAPLGRMGSLEVRLARSAAEVRAAQALRYSIFYG